MTLSSSLDLSFLSEGLCPMACPYLVAQAQGFKAWAGDGGSNMPGLCVTYLRTHATYFWLPLYVARISIFVSDVFRSASVTLSRGIEGYSDAEDCLPNVLLCLALWGLIYSTFWGTFPLREICMGKSNPAQRAEVVKFALRGCTKAHTRLRLKVSRAVVDRWWINSDGTAPCMEDLPRSGRPRLLGSMEAKAIKRSLKGGATLAVVKKRRDARGLLPVSRQTLRRAAARGRQPLSYQMEKAVRVLSDANKKARYDWTDKFDPSSHTPWVFMDGKVVTIYLGRRGNVTMRWAPVGKPPAKAKGRLLAHLHFYAAVAKGWRSKLYFVPPSPPVGSGKAKGDRAFEFSDYERIMVGLDRELRAHYGDQPFSIIRDRASQHIKAEKLEVLSDLNLPIVLDYPAQSWDINCIEHVWAQLVNQIRGNRAVTADGLRRVVWAGWRAIKQSTIDLLVENVPNRIMRIRDAKGEWIGAYSEVFPK